MRGNILFCLIAAALLLAVTWAGCGQDEPVMPAQVETFDGFRFLDWAIGPIEGITTAWHAAPPTFNVPAGTRLFFKCGRGAGQRVEWTNATEVRRVPGGSIAEYRVAAGVQTIEAFVVQDELRPDHGRKGDASPSAGAPTHACVVTGISGASPENVTVRHVTVSAAYPDLPTDPSNWETMRAFTTNAGRLTRTGEAAYRVSVARVIDLVADVADPRFAPLVEVRVGTARTLLGSESALTFDNPGRYTVSVGPPGREKAITFETYSVSITHDGPDPIGENVPYTFHARTDPPGYEHGVTWLASTRTGDSAPVQGTGPEFTVTFSGTNGAAGRWLGIRADNAVLIQDQNPSGTIHVAVVDSLGAPYSGVLVTLEGRGLNATTNAQGIVNFTGVATGNVPISLSKSFTVPNPFGDPIFVEVDVDSVANVIVLNATTKNLDIVFVCSLPPQKPACGTIPIANVTVVDPNDGTLSVTLESDKQGPCACDATYAAPGAPLPVGCPRKTTITYNPKPAAQLYSVVTATCLGGQGCEQPIASVHAAKHY